MIVLNSHLRRTSILRVLGLTIIFTIFLSSSFLIPNSKNITEIDRDINEFSQIPLLADADSILFEGNENALNVTDYGNLYKYNQEVSLTNQEEDNLNYYLDSAHEWKAYKVENTLKNIVDKRNWINNSGFQSPIIYRVYDTLDDYGTPHNYIANNNPNWNVPQDQITISGAKYIRVHFSRLQFEYGFDFVYITNSTEENSYYVNSTSANVYNFYSPWISGDTIKIDYYSDGADNFYGYDINYYEFMNSSSNIDINAANWEFRYQEDADGWNDHGPGDVDNATAMYIALYGEFVGQTQASFDTGAYSELFQEFTIESGPFVEAYLSFDYYCQYALPTNDHYIYVKINNEKIFTKGMLDISELGKQKWLRSGRLYTDSWDNLTNIFKEDLKNFNISIGFRIGAGYLYSGGSALEDTFTNIIWFDNISLVVTTKSNATQLGVDLTINSQSLQESSEWGSSNQTITQIWEKNPITLTLNTSSPNLEFDLNTTVYGYHYGKSMINQQNTEGVLYEILKNGKIYWEYYHNLYIPNQYADLEFVINKPKNWEIISALDPTLQEIPFEKGKTGDTSLKINKSYAIFPGWWTFRATSPNYLNQSNTKLLKQGEWTQTSFNTGESTRIKTQVNYSDEIPSNIELTEVNLTVFDPEGNQWYSEVKSPLSNGSVFFSELYFDALNTTGGQYDFTLFWSNGTALGGIKSNYIVYHQSQIELLKPDDAKLDLKTDGFVGDIIPVRIFLTDPENNFSITDAIVSYNWTGGTTLNFTEAAIGIYETILDTADLSSKGFYEVIISSSKLGFIESNLTLKINLGEETNLQRLQSEYNIELHANSSIKFKFTDYSGNSIDGAAVNISISNSSLYSIVNSGDGIYDIEFSTSYIAQIGVHQLNFTFSAIGYEPQYYIYQFQIVKQSVSISVFLNSLNIIENFLLEVTFFDFINISTRVKSNIDNAYILGGNITWVSEFYELNLSEFADYWYNSSIQCLPENFSSGINFVYLKFQHSNYRTETFGFEVLLNRIEFNVDIVGHEDVNPTVKTDIGSTLNLQIELLDININQSIVNATVFYEWTYGVGELIEVKPGIYQLSTKLPENLKGNFIFNLIISKEGTVYKTTQSSFLLVIGEPEFPVFLIWIIILISAAIISVLGILSLRSYVILPRRRKKEADLLSKTQRFKDIKNIQAIVVIHRYSGIPLYSKSYSILEKHKKELFSGFIQAIITVGEEMVGKREIDLDLTKPDDSDGSRSILELDFKYFYCLICDRQDLRIIFLLDEKASDRLKKLISDLSLGIMFELSELIENWDGAIHEFEAQLPPIIANYVELYYKDAFQINNAEYVAKLRKESELNSMETRILNVIYSIAKGKQEFHLETIFEVVHEKNQDLIIDAIETLINKQIIIPSNK